MVEMAAHISFFAQAAVHFMFSSRQKQSKHPESVAHHWRMVTHTTHARCGRHFGISTHELRFGESWPNTALEPTPTAP